MIRIFSKRSVRGPCSLLLFILNAGIFLYFLAPRLCAQESSQPPQAGIKATTEIVKVDASVLDRHGNFVGGLAQPRFRVLDDGVVQPVVFFAPVESPAQVLVLLETSPAVYLIRSEHLTAAYALLDGLAADDEVALVTYAQAPQALLAFTRDKSEFAAALGHVQYTLGMGNLNFFDSVSTVLDWIAPLRGKRAIVLLTTGLDSSPPQRWDALVEKLKADDVVLFPVALGGSLRQPTSRKKKKSKAPPEPDESAGPANTMSFAKADGALLALARITGGQAYFPESPNDFVPIYRQIASALRHQYLLGVAPQHDGKFHSLTVQILDEGGPPGAASVKHAEYQIFAREGYLAPAR
ncbi:MAG: VWA domain-containing protein [Candidatus Acidiferrales bacterium]